VDRELLLEIGCEEIPAGWLPRLTTEIGSVFEAELRQRRVAPAAPVETYSTPRRLAVRIARLSERQTDLEELVNGPSVAAGLKADGTPTPAAVGFAAKHGVDVAVLERVETPKGSYLAYRRRLRGRAAADVLPDVLAGTLRALSFPKQMHWDAQLADGRGELLFGRPIRWLLFVYGGRVVPFTIGRAPAAESSQVQDVRSGAVTYGHRFLATTGRAGRAIKVRTFDDYRTRLAENFVILERIERQEKIARDLDAQARKIHGRVARSGRGDAGLLVEVPDLVEYPSVVSGAFAPEFLELPEEVLTTTLIHHQHFFPVEDDDGRLKPMFLAVVNTAPEDERTIARNAERVVTARLRDARFFWEADRIVPLESRVHRLATLLFHRKLGSYRDKTDRVEVLARWMATEAFGRDDLAEPAARAARLAKADLTSDMVREFTELQGTMGGIYGREQGLPEEVWKAVYYHYLPVSPEADAAPTRVQLGRGAVTWAAVSLADKLDTIVGLFSAGERPTGSRDPYGLRRAAHGVFKILADLPETVGIDARPAVQPLLEAAADGFRPLGDWDPADVQHLAGFLTDRLSHLLESRGFDARVVRAVTVGRPLAVLRPADELRKLRVLPEFAGSEDFQQLAAAFKRVRNLARELPLERYQDLEASRAPLLAPEPAERALLQEVEERRKVIDRAVESGEGYREAFAEAARFKPAVDRFFDAVLVMAPDPALRESRLRLLRRLEQLVLTLADISEIVTED
jgi:glycyl-tRNA synthetase beta chain